MKKNMFRILVGQFVTVFGSQIYTFAISLFILKETGSGLSYGFSLALGMLPQFACSPIAGAFSDRFNRKKMIVLTDFLSGFLLLLIFFISGITGMKLYYIYCLMFLLSILGVFNSVALQAALPIAVKKEELSKLNSLSQSISSFSRIIAPWMGGVIILRIDIRLFMLINSISFLLAALVECYVKFTDNHSLKVEKKQLNMKQFFKDMKESCQYSKRTPIIFIIITFMIFMNFLFQFSFTVPVPYIINNTLKLSSQQYGVIQGVTSFGALLTSIIMSKKFKVKRSKTLLIRAMILMSILLILMGTVTLLAKVLVQPYLAFIFFVIFNFMFGGCIVASNIPMNVILQVSAEDSYRGRIMGLSGMLSSLITPFAVIISGALLDLNWLPPYLLCIAGGLVLLMLVLRMAARKELRL